MKYHILNGDSLAYSFADTQLSGEVIVCREALVEGDLMGNTLEEFWQARSKWLDVSIEDYTEKVVDEVKKVLQAPESSEFYLWFEYDLFCQVNMWFLLSIFKQINTSHRVFVVYTTFLDKEDAQFWNGYGRASNEELKICWETRIELNSGDIHYGDALWEAYKSNNLDELAALSKQRREAFPYIEEIIQAHIERFPDVGNKGRPERVIEDIISNVNLDFFEVCKEFWNRESIYGFGDTQLRKFYDRVISNR